MALPDIDFRSIRAHEGSQPTGFEELISQLAALEPHPPGAKYFRKGRGGDAGVECFVRLPDGSEYGWQAKYVFDWDGLAGQLDKSISAALRKHPGLTKYLVCIPFNLPDSRPTNGKSAYQKWEDWKSKWERSVEADRRTLEVSLWDATALHLRLGRTDPAHAGRLFYWFQTQSLTPDWFDEKFGTARANLGDRYTSETSVELPIRKAFLALARDPAIQRDVERWSVNLKSEGRTAVLGLRGAGSEELPDEHSTTLEHAIERAAAHLGGKPVEPDELYPLEAWSESIARCLDVARTARMWTIDLPPPKPPVRGSRPSDHARAALYRLLDILTTGVAKPS